MSRPHHRASSLSAHRALSPLVRRILLLSRQHVLVSFGRRLDRPSRIVAASAVVLALFGPLAIAGCGRAPASDSVSSQPGEADSELSADRLADGSESSGNPGAPESDAGSEVGIAADPDLSNTQGAVGTREGGAAGSATGADTGAQGAGAIDSADESQGAEGGGPGAAATGNLGGPGAATAVGSALESTGPTGGTNSGLAAGESGAGGSEPASATAGEGENASGNTSTGAGTESSTDGRNASPAGSGQASLERPADWTPADPSTHSLSIERLRTLSYPGSDITVVEELPAGANYSRSRASYLSEGLTIYGLLTVPNGDAPASGWPIVIFNHGYIPPAQYRTTERYVAYQDAFARAGYITFKSDYRGHGSSQGEASGGRGSPDYTIDVLNAMASVARLPNADPNRIGMWGHSMGGSITLRAMVLSNQIKAGVIWAGVVASYPDMYNRFGQSTSSNSSWNSSRRRGWRTELVELFGTPEENPAAWNAMSPNAYLHEISGPLQLHHGTADHSVPVEYSTRLQEQMDAVGRPSETFIYQGDDHNLSASLSTALARSVEFFDRHVKGSP